MAEAVKKPVKVQAKEWLFPLASLYALLLLPISVLAILAKVTFLPTLANPYGHAYEMLFGVAFLVICGYLLGNMLRWQLALLALSWLLARGMFLWQGFGWQVALISAVPALMLVRQVVPAFWRAKRWQNRSVAPVVLLIATLNLLAASSLYLFIELMQHMLIVLCALMFFMGGRIIAPLLASFWLQQGKRVGQRVQQQLEGYVLMLLAAAFVLGFVPALEWLAALLLIAAGASVWLRIIRWQAWQYRSRLDIVFLFIGYAFLGLALILLGAKAFLPRLALLSTHTVTVAALGLLMVTIMARVSMVKKFKDPNRFAAAHIGSSLLLISAVTRLLAPLLPQLYTPLLHSAMTSWSLGFACLLLVLWRCRSSAAA